MKETLENLVQLPCWAFDLDGVVVDSSGAHDRAFRQTFAAINIEFPDYRRFAGQATRDVIRTVLLENRVDANRRVVEALTSVKQDRALDFLRKGQGIELVSHVVSVLRKASEQGKILALVSSASFERAHLILDSLKLQSLFNHIVTADDVDSGKPSPDSYLQAGRLAKLERMSDVLVFEDSESGVAAGVAAGMKVIHFAPDSAFDNAAHCGIRSFAEIERLI
jgi:HAD superfamily hydrolase (TIGR01509 family)